MKKEWTVGGNTTIRIPEPMTEMQIIPPNCSNPEPGVVYFSTGVEDYSKVFHKNGIHFRKTKEDNYFIPLNDAARAIHALKIDENIKNEIIEVITKCEGAHKFSTPSIVVDMTTPLGVAEGADKAGSKNR